MSKQLIQIQLKKRDADNAPVGTAKGGESLDFAALQAKLAGSKGKQYWRSLEELAEKPEFAEYMSREFPGQAPTDWSPLSRRDFMKFMGAGLALAGVGGCAFQPQEKIVPYVKTPDDLIPGIPQFYATAMSLGGYGIGLLAESHEGRPTKLEGNPDHPSSLGATDVWAQAAVLNLWDPDRAQAVLKTGQASSFEQFTGVLDQAMIAARRNGGRGLHILTETVSSPTMARQLAQLKRQMPNAQVHSYDPVNSDNALEGARLAFGTPAQPIYHFDRADVVVSLDCNFLLEEPGHVRYARDWSRTRRVRAGKNGFADATMSRLYVAESAPTITGFKADHRMPMKPSQIDGMARAIAAGVGVAGVQAGSGNVAQQVTAIVADLQANRGRSIVCAGMHQPPAVHALCHAINQQLGNAGQTVTYIEPVTGVANQAASLRSLVTEMNAGRVGTLVILGGNPVYNAPADLKFRQAMDKVPLRIQLSSHEDETSSFCHWHVPEAHFLEGWSDVRAHDGTVSIVQPLIQPLYDPARSAHEILALILGEGNRTSYKIVRDTYFALKGERPQSVGTSVVNTSQGTDAISLGSDGQERGSGDMGGTTESAQVGSVGGGERRGSVAFETYWQTIVHDGIVPGTTSRPKTVAVRANLGAALPAPAPATGLEINFRPDPTVWDGRFANNGWLQELPKPLSKLTWDNAALMNPMTAEKLKLSRGTKVRLTVGGRSVIAPVLPVPGHPLDTVTAYLGGGRTAGGKLASGEVGFNAYEIRGSNAMGFAPVLVQDTGARRYDLATTDHHNLIDSSGPFGGTRTMDKFLMTVRPDEIDGEHGRHIIREGTLAEFKSSEEFEQIVPDHLLAGLPMIPTYASEHNDPRVNYKDPGAQREAEAHLRQSRLVDAHRAGKAGADHGGAPGAGGFNAPGGSHSEEAGSKANGAEKKDEMRETQPSLYPAEIDITKRYNDDTLNDPAYFKKIGTENLARPYGWGMTIDLNTCIGCNACVIGCQSENNIAVTGKDQVMNGRNLHWIRIDTYFKGRLDEPEATFQPMLCQHCEKAPCEPVCPVNASVHTYEGINEQVYNRCIGTRYCANNCPYKVRRFNYLQYSQQDTPTIMLGVNPDVTVRARGVMEKCTFCIQRVNYAKWQAEKEERLVRDGEIVTACQQVCPTNAIIFGDINDAGSQVRRSKAQPHNYGVLTDLNTYPRVTYLAKATNPNPTLERGERDEPGSSGRDDKDNTRAEAPQEGLTNG